MKCMVDGCPEEADGEAIGRGEIPLNGGIVEVDLFVCTSHRRELYQGLASQVSLAEVKA
jgi:hypothetical protein